MCHHHRVEKKMHPRERERERESYRHSHPCCFFCRVDDSCESIFFFDQIDIFFQQLIDIDLIDLWKFIEQKSNRFSSTKSTFLEI